MLWLKKKVRIPSIDAELAEIKRLCLSYLAVREHSRQELLQKLSGKNFPKESVDSVIDELAIEGWQSDVRFAESFIRQRIGKGNGPIRIEHELRQKGVENCDLRYFSEKLEINWQEVIEQVYIKKYTFAPLISKNEWAKQVRFLQYRGFSFDSINDLIDRLDIRVV